MINIFNSTIVLTNRCNLRCIYCYENTAGSNFAGEDISEEILSSSFKFLLKHVNSGREGIKDPRELSNIDTLSVYLWGGEPTLRPDLIRFSLKEGNKLAKKEGKKIKWRISTNGALINEEIAQLINGFEIYLSVDDYGIVQEKTRGCSSKYLKSDVWKKLLNTSYMVVRIVNHPKYAGGRLVDQVKSLMDLGFTRFFPSTASGHGWSAQDFKVMEKEYETLTKMHFDGKIQLPNLDEYFREKDNVSKTALWNGEKTPVCITTKGDVYPSDLESFLDIGYMGNILDGVQEGNIKKAAIERSCKVDKNDVCGNCIAKRYCPGYGNVVYYNNIKKDLPNYYRDCCGEYIAKIRCWYKIKTGREPVDTWYRHAPTTI